VIALAFAVAVVVISLFFLRSFVPGRLVLLFCNNNDNDNNNNILFHFISSEL
jgi:hypothetical protein